MLDIKFIKENKDIINDFIGFDYVGAPLKCGLVGNGGLSLRRKSKMLEIIDQNSKQNTIEIHGKIFNSLINPFLKMINKTIQYFQI